MRKRIVVSMLAAITCFTTASTTALADSVTSDMKVAINGKASDLSSNSLLVDHNLYSPYESVAQSLGLAAKWQEDAKTLTLTKEGNTLEMTVGAAVYKINGLSLPTATPLQLIGGSIVAPVRSVSETFGNEVTYNDKLRTVALTSGSQPSLQVFGLTEQQAVIGSELKVAVVALKAGEGYTQAAIDGEPAMDVSKGQPVIFNKLAPGEHKLTVQLVGKDKKPVQPEVKKVINFRMAQASVLVDLDPENATGMRTEGITGDRQGRLYTVDSNSKQLFRIVPETGKAEVLTVLPHPATGLVMDKDGNMYMASGGQEGVILRIPSKVLEGGPFDGSLVETFVSGTVGANGMVFDAKGNLYVSGGANGNVYVVSPSGELKVWASGIVAERKDQLITVNGLDFDKDGRLYIANTSSGEINRVAVNADGTFGKVELFAKDARLYGADGIMFGPNGDLYVCANELNSVVKVSSNGKVTEVAGSPSNQGTLEFPASVHVVGNTLYVSNFDQPRGVNKPNEPGIGASVVKIDLTGK
ncbi:stalk domain-containing protein [Paenibacillus sp. UNC451MF]|uniref:stalk domain-containing protein n=1 Tax=Paenibacillus sp. UNC451MF TaxID=1449063 RepID=UPI0006917C7F|nr:SMP-30/gluconolactonase/LRE family protein [Paenibacillus sp. UNC451MF]